jgi:hypothetical protein
MLYYARAVDPTMLTTTNTIASQQAIPTEAVKAQAVRLLQYAAAHPNNAIVYKKSKMHVILQVDASYLSRSNARSVAGGVAYFGDADNPTKKNDMIYAISYIIDVVVLSAGEAEYGAAFIFAQQGVGIRNIATALGHMQPPTPILCDNQFAIGLAIDTIKQKNPRVSTCAFIGFAIASGKASSLLHTSQAPSTWRTFLPRHYHAHNISRTSCYA